MPDATETTLDAVFAELKVTFASDLVGYNRRWLERAAEKLGPALNGVSNDRDRARCWRETLRPLCSFVDGAYVVNESRMQAWATEAAGQTVAKWSAKIAAKLGELDDARVTRFAGVAFNLVGSRNGRPVRIERQPIFNVSSYGVPFYQFPARIYVDGKLTSEAAYKKLFG